MHMMVHLMQYRFFITVTSILFFNSIVRADDAQVGTLLQALHQAGTQLTSLAADVSLADIDPDLGDQTTRRGTLVLQRLPDGDTRLRVSLVEKITGNRTTPEQRDVVLQGSQLIDRDHRTKKQTTRQVRKPGEKVDLFKLGQGPFPLPVGQSPDEVHAQFDVTPGQLPDTVVLSPKPDTALSKKFKQIIVSVNLPTGLPSRIETIDPNESSRTIATLSNVRINQSVNDTEFILPQIDEKEWNLVDE
jgi:hypothetical protein